MKFGMIRDGEWRPDHEIVSQKTIIERFTLKLIFRRDRSQQLTDDVILTRIYLIKRFNVAVTVTK